MELLPYEISISKPAYLYGATSLERTEATTPTKDVFTTKNYHYLADAPIMYAPADTAYLQVSQTKVLVAVYSPGKVVNAKGVAGELLPVLKAQEKYLNGKLPVDRYAFLIHLSDNPKLTRYGALEHSYSSMYYLPEFLSPKELSESIKDVAAHEFFHIITPLNVHSEEIGNFNYIQPEMSQHLWMYEGLTEYAAHHAQVRGGLINQEEYLKRMARKIEMSRTRYNDTLPFTMMSKLALGKYKLQYDNVYQKGALIGLCLDLSLLNLSNGKYGTRELMEDLGKTYGKDKSFKDDELFTIIGQKTYPQIESFLRSYVAGNKPLPLDSIFNLAGIKYTPNDTAYEMEIEFSTNFGLIEGTDTLVVSGTSTQSALGKRLGLTQGDKLIAFNGEPFTFSNYQQRFQQYQETAKLGSQVSWKVLRKNSNGIWEEKLLTATIQNELTKEHTLKPMTNASEKQNALRRTWLLAN
jgi:predicted metalloprotease with PDZ domain